MPICECRPISVLRGSGSLADPRINTGRIKIVLVNLLSRMYGNKRQGPLAVDTLTGFLRVTTKAEISRVDMQLLLDAQPKGALLDERYEVITEKVIKELIGYKPDLVGFSLKWGTTRMAEEIVCRVKKALGAQAPLFIGGGGTATFAADEARQQRPELKNLLMVCGEGEEALRTIIERAAQNPEELRDLHLYKGIPNVKTAVGEEIEYRVVDLGAYPKITEADLPEYFYRPSPTPIESSRGCPWGACTFCSLGELYDPKQKRSVIPRQYSVEYILDRIARIVGAKKGLNPGKRIALGGFIDSEWFGRVGKESDFISSVDRARRIAAGIMALNAAEGLSEAERIEVQNFSARVDTVAQSDPDRDRILRDLFLFLKEAGFASVYLGIESGSPSQLLRYRKGTTVEENEAAIARLDELDFPFEPGFIFFDHLATMDELRENIAFIERTKLHLRLSRVIGEMRPQLGSKYPKQLEKKGLLGPMEIDSLTFPSKYADPEVEAVKNLYLEWEQQNRGIFTRIYGLWVKRNDLIEETLREIGQLNFDFIKEYVAIETTPDKRNAVLQKHLEKQRKFLEKLEGVLSRGEINDPSGIILKTLTPEARKINAGLRTRDVSCLPTQNPS